MSFTRISDDTARVDKYLQETTDQGKYMLTTPGHGMNPHYMEDPHYRLTNWAGNLAGNAIDLENDLRGLTRLLNRDELEKNTHHNNAIQERTREMSQINSAGADQSRVTNPAWWHREEQQYRGQHLFENPQDHSTREFSNNVSSRYEQKQ